MLLGVSHVPQPPYCLLIVSPQQTG